MLRSLARVRRTIAIRDALQTFQFRSNVLGRINTVSHSFSVRPFRKDQSIHLGTCLTFMRICGDTNGCKKNQRPSRKLNFISAESRGKRERDDAVQQFGINYDS